MNPLGSIASCLHIYTLGNLIWNDYITGGCQTGYINYKSDVLGSSSHAGFWPRQYPLWHPVRQDTRRWNPFTFEDFWGVMEHPNSKWAPPPCVLPHGTSDKGVLQRISSHLRIETALLNDTSPSLTWDSWRFLGAPDNPSARLLLVCIDTICELWFGFNKRAG